jgi:hypothetical protein
MAQGETERRFLLCLKNAGYPASLEIRKVYLTLPDAGATARGYVRVIDESGEDYLYPSDFFVAIELPSAAVSAFAGTS